MDELMSTTATFARHIFHLSLIQRSCGMQHIQLHKYISVRKYVYPDYRKCT